MRYLCILSFFDCLYIKEWRSIKFNYEFSDLYQINLLVNVSFPSPIILVSVYIDELCVQVAR